MAPWGRILRATGLAAFAALAVVLVFFTPPARPPANRVVLDDRPAALAGPTRETTLRNVTREPITYTIQPNVYRRSPRTRTLQAGDLDRIPTEVSLEIAYDNKSHRTVATVFPDQPYSFRYDGHNLIHLYPGSHGLEDTPDLAPYVPTPQPIVERMLTLAAVGRGDVVYDLGCGDGRMIVSAARLYRARGVGVDIDENLVRESEANARAAGVEHLTRFLHMDATKAALAEATVLSLYLLPESLEDLRPKFERELRPGTRVVSHNYKVPGWEDKLAASESMDEGGRTHRIYLYVR